MMVVTVSDLLRINQDEYTRRKNPEHKTSVPGFEMCAHTFDEKSHHGASAFYNEKEKALIIAHRGSATLKDWVVTDAQIAFNVKETKADRDAVLFAERTMRKLDREGKEVSLIVETGHSKGGRESQMVLKHLMQKHPEIPSYSLTFNSATISSKHGKDLSLNNHINLRGNGGNFLKKDIVSSVRNHFGDNIDFHNPHIKGPISAHSINSFEKGFEDHPDMAQMDVVDFINSEKNAIYKMENDQSSKPLELPSLASFRQNKANELGISRDAYMMQKDPSLQADPSHKTEKANDSNDFSL